MNRFKQILVLAFFATLSLNAGADDRWETLRAINWVENPSNHTRMGRYGELGPYQFRPATWRMHTKRPFSQAVQREAADEVAVKHYEWIKASLERAGVHPSSFNIAMAWNSGVTNVLKGRVPHVTYNYAERVTNLVETFKQRATSAAPTSVAAIVAPPPVAPRAPTFSLEKPVVSFAVPTDAPKFEIALAVPVADPVVYTNRTANPPEIQASHRFTFTTTATLTPRFNLLPSLVE